MSTPLGTTITLACLMAAGMSMAASGSSVPASLVAMEHERYVLPDAEQRLLTANGRQYQVFIAAPPQPPPEGGYSVIYVLDGNTMFLTTAEAARAYARRRDESARRRALVVGIGYPPGADIPAARTFDLTPPSGSLPSERPTGGAAAFLDFIEHDLKPLIARDYPVDSKRQALIGHSLAGLFVIDTLTRRPEAFQAYVAMSASFWFDDHAVLPRIDAFAQRRRDDDAPLRLLLTVGEYEGRPRPEAWMHDPERARDAARKLGQRAQVTHARRTAERLSRAPAMLADFREVLGEDHGSVIPAAIGRGVDFILAGPESVPAVPSSEAYQRLGPEGRYRLRMQVRALPDFHRIPWLERLRAVLDAGLDTAGQAALSEERDRMDREFGSAPSRPETD